MKLLPRFSTFWIDLELGRITYPVPLAGESAIWFYGPGPIMLLL